MGTKSDTAVLKDLKELGEMKGEILQVKSPVIVAAVQTFEIPDEVASVREIRDERIRLYAAEYEYNQQLEKIRKAWAEFDIDQTIVALRADIKELHSLLKTVEVKDEKGKLLYKIPQVCPDGQAASAYNALQAKLKDLKEVHEQDKIVPLLNQLESMEADHQAFLELERNEQKEWDDANKKA